MFVCVAAACPGGLGLPPAALPHTGGGGHTVHQAGHHGHASGSVVGQSWSTVRMEADFILLLCLANLLLSLLWPTASNSAQICSGLSACISSVWGGGRGWAGRAFGNV